MNVITFWLVHGKGSNQIKASSGNHEDRFIFQISATISAKKLDLRSLIAHEKDLNAF
jgi:hypothetical protein